MKKYFRFLVVFLVLSCWLPHIATAQVVNVPDPNLAAALRETLGLAPNAPITRQQMQRLIGFEAINRQIRDLTGLEHAPQLAALDLGGNQISDIRPLAGMRHLGALSLAENRIRDVSPLTQMTQLEWLYLWGNQISDIRPLSGMTQLQRLLLGDNQIRDVSSLSQMTQLELLNLSDNQISDLSSLTGMTRLVSLGMNNNQIRDIQPLARLTQLRELIIGQNQISNLSPLTGMTQLVRLALNNNQIRDIRPLAGLTALRQLFLELNQISDVSPLAGLTQLQELWLAENNIRDVSPLSKLVNLEKLLLAGNPVTDTSPLAGLTKLAAVDVRITVPPAGPVSKSVVPDANLAAAVRKTLGLAPNAPITRQNMQSLTTLDAGARQVTNLAGLEHATQLFALALDENQIRDVSPLAGLTQLSILSLSNNQIRDVSPLSGLTGLMTLFLWHNQISDVSPLAGLTNLTELYLVGNPITDTSPLASLTKLVDVDVRITAPSSPPQPIPEDPTQQDSEPAPQETTVPVPQDPTETPQDGDTQPKPETFTPSVITAGQITFSELMFATTGGLFSQPQWIELYNNAPITTEPVNLRGSRLVIEARDSEARHRYSVIEFGDLHIAPNWTVLLVTRGNKRSSEHLTEERVYDLYDHSNVSSLGLPENAVLPASGFAIKLLAANGTLVDIAGNLDGVKKSKDTPTWELPPGWTEDRARTSLIRRYEDGTALPGTEAMSWVRAADVQLVLNTYYGRETDVGTPGYRRGGPLPVVLSTFRSERTDAGVSIEWTTESETDNAGFNILRSQTKDGAFVKVNPTLIQGAGTTAERNNYTWTDTTAKPNVAYYYRIEDVSFSGERQRLATVRMRGYVSASDKLTTTWSQLKVQD